MTIPQPTITTTRSEADETCETEEDTSQTYATDETDQTNETNNTYKADRDKETQGKTPDGQAAPDDDTAPYAGEEEDPTPETYPETHSKPYEEPAQANYNHEPPLPFDTYDLYSSTGNR